MPALNNVKLSIIIVSWNVKEDLIQCLRSLYENRPADSFEVIVIDNASTDGTVEAVKSSFSDVVIIANDKNRGFAAANNQGIKKSTCRHILFLNPDTIVQPDSLDVLIKFMDKNEDAGACGPRLLNEDGTIQPSTRRFPTFRGALYRHTAFRYFRIFRNEYKKWLMKDFDYKTQLDVDQVMGAALMVKRSVIDRIGTMDEQFFMYYEEVDLCCRIKQAGLRVVFVPEAQIRHRGGHSAGQIPVKKRIMMLASLLKFFRKHRGRFITALFNLVFKPAVVIRDVCNVITAVVGCLLGFMTMDKERWVRSETRFRNSVTLVGRYSWRLLFRM